MKWHNFKVPTINHSTSIRMIQIVIGVIFFIHGTIKVFGGREQWQFLGEQLQFFGINFFPVFFGLLATATETIGGLMLVFNFKIRLASLFLIGTMIVALVFMIFTNGTFSGYSYPLTNLLILLIFFFSRSSK